MNPRYGSFDGIASRYDAREAWVLHGNEWVPINHSSHGDAVRELSKGQFNQLFQNVPPLPDRAFRLIH